MRSGYQVPRPDQEARARGILKTVKPSHYFGRGGVIIRLALANLLDHFLV
jgi:hypothetical protein